MENNRLNESFVKLQIDQSYTLFLDRDGVLNKRLYNDYVKHVNELELLPGVGEAIAKFSQIFGRILVVTNQQGIGKGLMKEEDLNAIHNEIRIQIERFGGKIDQFYFAPQLANENHPDRKPGVGMGLRAKSEFPEVDFKKSIMIGDSESDIEFGMNLEMKTIMLINNGNQTSKADYIFKNLLAVANAL